jgi:hypothetical protein
MTETPDPDAVPAVTVSADWWKSLPPDARSELLKAWGLPPLVMASFDRSTMAITMRAPDVDDLLAAMGA